MLEPIVEFAADAAAGRHTGAHTGVVAGGDTRAVAAIRAATVAWIRLSLCPGLTPRLLHDVLRAFGSPEAVLDASPSSLAPLLPAPVIASLRETADDEVKATLDWSTGPGNHLLTWDDARYPRALLQLTDPPPVLFCKGDPAHLNTPALAIVGSRNASPGGLQTAGEFAEAFASAGLTVVSGLALGIDAAAHRGALKATGPGTAATVAVIGTGIDRVYPPRNRDLAHAIAEAGAIVSEFPLGTPPLTHNFPRRNRLISGLSRGVLVVEAALGSGSLITARFAGEQGKDVFAIPGSIHSPFSKGCHRLIKQGAKLVDTAHDVLDELGLSGSADTGSGASRHGAGALSADEQALLDALGYDPVTTDDAALRTGWPIDKLMSVLLHLELAGSVRTMPGGRLQRVS